MSGSWSSILCFFSPPPHPQNTDCSSLASSLSIITPRSFSFLKHGCHVHRRCILLGYTNFDLFVWCVWLQYASELGQGADQITAGIYLVFFVAAVYIQLLPMKKGFHYQGSVNKILLTVAGLMFTTVTTVSGILRFMALEIAAHGFLAAFHCSTTSRSSGLYRAYRDS